MATEQTIDRKEDEFIIRGDNIIRREVFEVNMGQQRELLASLQSNASLQFTPLRIYPADDLNGFIDHHFVGYHDSEYVIFTKINFFPLYGAHLTQKDLTAEQVEDGVHILECTDYRRADENQLSDRQLETKRTTVYMDDEPLKWAPDPSSNVELYIMNTWHQSSRSLSQQPRIFARNVNNNSYFTLRLPNVYDNGVICVGYGWRRLNRPNSADALIKPLAQAEHALRQIRDVPCNSDLYHRNLTQLFAQWDKNGKQLPILGEINPAARCTVSNEWITQFMEWRALNSTIECLPE